MEKHAYLIMAHEDLYILEKLIELIDDERNDIYLHVDKKIKDFDFEYYKNKVKKSELIFTKRLDVRWGDYSQIKCELLLFETASPKNYQYYHVLSGVDLPLVDQDTIHNFFNNNKGKEFISFDLHNKTPDQALERIRYYHFFSRHWRSNNKLAKKIFSSASSRILNLEKKLKINRINKIKDLEVRKGANWVSITDDLVKYILANQKNIKKMFEYSRCGDEFFIQTLTYNSKFYKNLYNYQDDNNESIKRCIDWKRGQPYTFKLEDFDLLIRSNCFFARKFSTATDKKIIDKIYAYVRGDVNEKS